MVRTRTEILAEIGQNIAATQGPNDFNDEIRQKAHALAHSRFMRQIDRHTSPRKRCVSAQKRKAKRESMQYQRELGDIKRNLTKVLLYFF